MRGVWCLVGEEEEGMLTVEIVEIFVGVGCDDGFWCLSRHGEEELIWGCLCTTYRLLQFPVTCYIKSYHDHNGAPFRNCLVAPCKAPEVFS